MTLSASQIPGWNGTHSVFAELVNEVRPRTIVEIGSWKGQSTASLATACRDLELETRIYCVDTWLGALEFYTDPSPDRDLMKRDGYPQVYYEFKQNMENAGHWERIVPVPLPSTLGLKYLQQRALCQRPVLIYIDASHEYEDVKRDIELAMGLQPHIIFGDDYTNTYFPGVRRAVDEFEPVEVVHNWYWVKRLNTR